MLKPSEHTPATSALLARLLSSLFPPEKVAVVQGDAAVGADFAALPFDHLIFTGSTRVGRAVMAAAAGNLVPVTLELGGKSPVIVAKGHAVSAAAGVAFGKLINAGQTCIAPDYLMLRPEDLEPFVAAYDRAVRQLYPEGPASSDYTSIINDHHYQRLAELLEDARAKGARIIPAGLTRPATADKPRSLPPVVVLDVNDEMKIMQEEIFGPLLPIRVYHDIDEAIDYVNRRPHPLALYYFGAAGADRSRVLDRTFSGNVTINNTLVHYAQDDLPFGGIGSSGMGAYHGIEGFRALSHARGVLEQRPRNLSNLLRPPFTAVTEFIVRRMLK